jgi:hypothetical protein
MKCGGRGLVDWESRLTDLDEWLAKYNNRKRPARKSAGTDPLNISWLAQVRQS